MLDVAELLKPQKLTPDPQDAPIVPLGHRLGVYYLISGQGEFMKVTPSQLGRDEYVYALFNGGSYNGLPVEEWLAEYFPPKRDRPGAPRGQYSHSCAGRWLMAACAQVSAEKGVFDPMTPVRGVGVWRIDGSAVAHCGMELLWPGGQAHSAGVETEGAIYASCPPIGFPVRPSRARRLKPGKVSPEAATATEIRDLEDKVAASWGWQRAADRVAWFGWVGCAALGAFPEWRPHMWVTAGNGSGKSELAKLAKSLLGPMCPIVNDGFTAAGVRQERNNLALAHIFDEAEGQQNKGRVEDVIEMFRGMSSGDGARTLRGGADHKAVDFRNFGAGYLSSIIHGRLEPQDRSRFVTIRLDPLPGDVDLAEAMARYHDIIERGNALNPRLWRRVLDRSGVWDRTYAAYFGMVQRIGGRSRDAATIGAVLAGYDMLTEDTLPDAKRLKACEAVARVLLDEAREAVEFGEGEQCWDHLMQSIVPRRRSNDRRALQTLIAAALGGGDENEALGNYGFKVDPPKGDKPGRVLLCARKHKQLTALFRETHWGDGAHKQALLLMPGVEMLRSAKGKRTTVRINNSQPVPCLTIPEKYWPEPILRSLDNDVTEDA